MSATSFEPVCDQLRTSFEPDSVMEFGFKAAVLNVLRNDVTFNTSRLFKQLIVMAVSKTEKQALTLEMWASAQCDGRPAEYRWRPLFNAAKFGSRPLLECRAVSLPRSESH